MYIPGLFFVELCWHDKPVEGFIVRPVLLLEQMLLYIRRHVIREVSSLVSWL